MLARRGRGGAEGVRGVDAAAAADTHRRLQARLHARQPGDLHACNNATTQHNQKRERRFRVYEEAPGFRPGPRKKHNKVRNVIRRQRRNTWQHTAATVSLCAMKTRQYSK